MWSDLDDADAADDGDDGEADAGWRARQTSNLHHSCSWEETQKCLITYVVNQDDV